MSSAVMPPARGKLRSIGSTFTKSAKANGSREKVRLLKLMVTKLQEELDSLSEVATLDVESGVNFYDEVRRFEIELIKRALMVMDGRQTKAAKLLQMNATTLNAKIKSYNIRLGPQTYSTPKNRGVDSRVL